MRAGTVTATGLVALLTLAGCKRVGELPLDPHASEDDHGVEEVHAPEAPPDQAGEHTTTEAEESGPGSPGGPLMFVSSVLVEGRVGPGGLPFEVARRTMERVGHQRTIGRRTYSIALRSEKLTYYPCSSCHVGGRPVFRDGVRAEDAHQDIRPVHPAENNAVCTACHVASDPEWLTLAGTDPVPLNEAYKLCAQCHFIQVDAWAGGAHGKRLDTWRGPRVVMSCTDCHDPHDPGIPTRIPYPGPRVPRTGPRQP